MCVLVYVHVGNCDLTGYVIEGCRCTESGSALDDYRRIGQSDVTDCHYKALALDENQFYMFRVRAHNKAGDSDDCYLVNPVQARQQHGGYYLSGSHVHVRI